MVKAQPNPEALLAALRQAGIRPGIAFSLIVGATIKQMREAQNLAQRDLAERAGVTQPSLSRVELGDSVVDVDQLLVLAEALGSEPSAILLAAEEVKRRLRENDFEVARRRDQSGLDSLIGAAGATTLLQLFGAGAVPLVAPPATRAQGGGKRR